MTLTGWLKAHHYTDAAFARLITDRMDRIVTAASVFKWKRGTMPAWDAGEAIGLVTGGEVTPRTIHAKRPLPSSEGEKRTI